MSLVPSNKSGDKFFKIGALLILSVSLLVGSVILSRAGHTRPDELAFGARGVIYTADRNGFNLTPLTGDNLKALSPSWSPDGQRIAFIGQPKDTHVSRLSIYIISLYDSRIEQVTDPWQVSVFSLSSLSWSPDGKKIAFDGSLADSQKIKVYFLDIATGQITLIADELFSPKWSPDGQSLAVSGDNQICVLRVESGSRQCHTLAGEQYPQYPFWSPDGTQIGFVGDDGLYSIKPDGSDIKRLSSLPPIGACDPIWVPNEELILLADCAENSTGMYVLDLKTLQFSHLILFDRAARSPSWKPLR